jgi:ZIP family zinc transporter
MNDLVGVLLLSTGAGLATGLGGLMAISRRPGQKQLGFMMGFTAGVMLALAFVGLLWEAWEEAGYSTATIAFAAGALTMFAIDVSLPHIRFAVQEPGVLDRRLFTTGLLIAVGITVHNIPEGAAVGASYIETPELGAMVAAGIALHNVPEGVATALPIYASGASKLAAFRISLFSGLVEPAGALAAALLLTSFDGLVPAALAFAAGVMVFITLDELVPAARREGHEHYTALGIIIGGVCMFLVIGGFGS